MADAVVVGICNVSHKDELVLKALVRLMEGGVNLRVRFSEQLADCNVVFYSGAVRPAQLRAGQGVRILEGAASEGVVGTATDGGYSIGAGEWTLGSPLRMSSVISVLQAAAQRMHGAEEHDPAQSLRSLFAVLFDPTRSSERRRMVVPVSSGQQIVVDFAQQRVHTAMSMDSILSGDYTLDAPHRVSLVEEALIRSAPEYNLRQLVWMLSHRLALLDVATPTRAGRYRLRRWPDAVALTAPGYPRLAAVWTQRAFSLSEIDAVARVPSAAARWFLEACLALDLAVEEAEARPAAGGTATPAQPQAQTNRRATPSWLGQLREKLKLW